MPQRDRSDRELAELTKQVFGELEDASSDDRHRFRVDLVTAVAAGVLMLPEPDDMIRSGFARRRLGLKAPVHFQLLDLISEEPELSKLELVRSALGFMACAYRDGVAAGVDWGYEPEMLDAAITFIEGNPIDFDETWAEEVLTIASITT